MVAQFFPLTTDELAIGLPNDLLLVDSSFQRQYDWLGFEGDTCSDEPIDFTGFNLIAEILDSADVVLDTFQVTPSTGDDTGIFELYLAPAQVNANLRDNAVRWRFRMTDGGGTVNQPLVYARFKVT